MRCYKTLLFGTCAFLLITCSTKSQQIVDGIEYRGEMIGSKGGVTTINLILKQDTRQAVISSSLGISNLPVSINKLTEDSLVFEVPAYWVTYKGAFESDARKIVGTWQQGPKSLTLNFETTEKATLTNDKKSQQKNFDEKEVVIKISDEVTLAGTLTLPKIQGETPAVILLGVAGKTDRDQTFGPYKSFQVIAERLSNEGFAVLRCDDRGVGKSTGSLYESSYDDLVKDAEQMISYLKQLPTVDSTKVGALGISEGSALTGILAGKNKLGFAVLLSYPALNGTSTIWQQIRDLSKIYNFNEKQQALLLADFETVTGLILRNTDPIALKNDIKIYLDASPQELRDLTKYLFVPVNTEEAAQLYAGPWYRSQLMYEPSPYQENIQCPALFLYGANDPFVNPTFQIPALEKNLKAKHSQTVIKKMQGVNHIFQDAKTGSPLEYIQNGNDFSPRALDEIVIWLKQQDNEN